MNEIKIVPDDIVSDDNMALDCKLGHWPSNKKDTRKKTTKVLYKKTENERFMKVNSIDLQNQRFFYH